MTDNRERPDIVFDPSQNVWEIRYGERDSTHGPGNGSPGHGTDGPSKPPSSQKPSGTPYLIPIPIGLILCLVVNLIRGCGSSDNSRYVFQSERASVFRSESDFSDFSLGSQAYFLGKYDAAITFFTAALDSHTPVGEVYNRRALAYQAQGEHAKALQDFEQALSLSSNLAMVYNNRAITYLALADYDTAMADLDRAIELQPTLGKAYYNRGLVNSSLGDYDLAIADFGQALKFPASASSSLLSRSPVERPTSFIGDMIEASELEREFLDTGADLPSVLLQRALAYQAKGEVDSALADLDKAIELQPDSSEAYYARSWLRLSQGDYEQARADCQTILELGNDPELQGAAEQVLDLIGSSASGPPASVPTAAPWSTRPVKTPTEQPSVPIALYVPQPGETPTTPIWENQASCDEKPFSEWGLPGTYLYSGAGFRTVKLKLGESPSLPGSGSPLGAAAASPGLAETITTSLGTFQALRVDTAGSYERLTGRLDYYKGTYKSSTWYVCGFGVVQFASSDIGTKSPATNPNYNTQSQVELLSFTPMSTNESHVRYILADMHLGNVAEEYRADVADEETAEALRLWDAGVRVVNLYEFERKIVDGRWRIVHAGTDNPVTGTDIILTGDPPQ